MGHRFSWYLTKPNETRRSPPSAAITVSNFGGFLQYGGAVGLNTNGSTNTPNGLGAVSTPSNPATGLPTSGSTFASGVKHSFMMPTFSVIVNYANGTSLPIAGDVVSPDWFGSGNLACATGGRYEPDNNGYDIHSGGQPDLWQVDVAVPDTVDPISSLTLTYDGGDRSEVAIFSVRGAVVPEPASLGMLAIASLGLLGRRRHARA